MNNIQLSQNLRIHHGNSDEKSKNEYAFETPLDQRIIKNKNSKSNQQLMTRNSNDPSGQGLSLTQQLNISKLRNGMNAIPDTVRKGNSKFQVASQFRGKNTKRPSNHGAPQQMLQIQNKHQSQGYLRQSNQPQTTTNANRQPIFGASMQTMQTLQQQQQRMNSQPSQKSLRSQGSTEGMNYASQDNQYRRRLVALAQAQQQQILAVHQANSQKNSQRMWHDNTRRTSNETNEGDSEVGNGIKVLSKKMINFKNQSSSVEKNRKLNHGEQVDRMAELRSQQPTVKSAENNRLNHTQGFKINFQENGCQSQRPNADDSMNTNNKNSSANVSQSQFKGYKTNSKIASNKTPGELSPRKSTEPYGGAMVAASIQSNNGSTSNSRDKVARIISGNPQRRLQQQNHGGGAISSSKGSSAATTGAGDGVVSQSAGAASAAQHALQAYNRRRQPQGGPEVDATVRNGLFLASNSLVSSGETTQRITEHTNGPAKHKLVHPDSKQQKRNHPNMGAQGGNNVLSAPGEKVDNAQKLVQTGVIYHPHPLNQHISGSENLVAQQAAQAAKEQARPHSEKYDVPGAINNRNSRKALKPLGAKKKSQNINLAQTQKSLKQIKNAQYQTNHQFADLSSSRERTAPQQQILVGQNYSTSHPQILTHESVSHIQSNVSTTTNMSNQNAMFKFKKNSSANRGQPAVASYDTNHLSNTARRPIMIRKNNYVIQQQAPMHPMRTIQDTSNPRQRPPGGVTTSNSNQNSSSVGARKKTINTKMATGQGQHLQFSNSEKKQQSNFKATGTATVAFESGLGEIASLAGLPGFENFVLGQQNNNLELTGPQMEQLRTQLLKVNDTPSSRENQLKQAAQTQRTIEPTSKHYADQSDSKTVLASLTAPFSTAQKNSQLKQDKVSQAQTSSQASLPVASGSSNQKLIKVNKSKKMLDTARRSRIQQLDKDKDNYNTSAIQGVNQLNPGAVNSNGTQPMGANSLQVKQQANKASSNKPLASLNMLPQNFNSTTTGAEKPKLGSLLSSNQNSNIKNSNQENNYPSTNTEKVMPGGPKNKNQNGTLQLNMNIGTRSQQSPAKHQKQQMSSSDGMQQRKNSKGIGSLKPSMKELPTSQLPLAIQNLQNPTKGKAQNVNLNLMGIQNSARTNLGATHQGIGINVQSAQVQAANTQRVMTTADPKSARQPKPEEEQFTEKQSQGGSNQKPYRRGQIFKKQQNKNNQQNTNSSEALQTLNSLQVAKNVTDTKEQPNQFIPTAPVKKKQNPAVKIENQLSQKHSLNQSLEAPEEEKKTLSLYQADLDGIQAEHSLGETDPEFTNQMQQVIQEIEGKNNKEADNNLNHPNLLNEISEEDLVLDADQTEDEPQDAGKGTEEKKKTQLLQQQKNSLASATKKVLQIHNKVTEQRTTTDTNPNSQRKQTNDTQGTTGRVNINTSIVNQPRGLINTAFSLSSVASRDERPELPTTPQNILRYYINELSDYEKAEVLDYDMIYFLGNKEKKVDGVQQPQQQQLSDRNKDLTDSSNKPSSKSSSQKEEKETKDTYNHNYGYDDDKGDYKIVMGDHIGYRYEIVEFLGKGSFGTALRCIDHKEKKNIAVKIVKNKKKYYYQASVELKILQYLKQHDVEDIMNVVHIYDYVVFRKHLCMGFELLSMNLFEFLKINDFNGFDHNLIRRFAIQLLYALKYLKQLEIIHCDLKPENILLKEENKSGIKIIDFGSSTFIDEKVYTYIQSRFYRAPEIMLGIPYTPAIDMWSLGCIMAELYIGYPIFPGESENDQMSRIMEMCDAPSTEVLKMSERKMKFFTLNKETHTLDPIMLKNSRGKLRKPNGKPLDYVIGDEDPDFNDFVIKCLDWNPNTRLTPDEALKHVWVLKGLPPQVLIHHQKMHNITTPELPEMVKVARDEFLVDQHREQQMILKQQQRQMNSQKSQNTKDLKRDISHNPENPRPHIKLKTPRTAQKPAPIQTNANTQPAGGSYPTSAKADTSKITLSNVNSKKFTTIQHSENNQNQGNTRRKYTVKKLNQ